MPHPHHQGLENCLFVWHVDVVTRQELGNFISWEQKKFLVFYYFYEVFLKIKGDFNALVVSTGRNSFFLGDVGFVNISFLFSSTIQGHAGDILKIRFGFSRQVWVGFCLPALAELSSDAHLHTTVLQMSLSGFLSACPGIGICHWHFCSSV